MTLNDILAAAQQESEVRQRKHGLAEVRRKAEKMGPARGFARVLRARRFSVIAEIKRKSPSMGPINEAAIAQAHKIYHSHPVVAAISVLTQTRYFGGGMEDLQAVRQLTQVRPKPILRKDFIFSEYEVYYSRWMGADAILLMANVVTDRDQFRRLHDLALSLGMDVLCEVHEADEIGLLPETAQVCGINARRFSGVKDLGSLTQKLRGALGGAKTDTKTDLGAFNLFNRLPDNCVKVAESGMTADNIADVLTANAFDAALIGTSLLKAGSDIGSQLDAIQSTAEQTLRISSKRAQELAATR